MNRLQFHTFAYAFPMDQPRRIDIAEIIVQDLIRIR